MINRRTIFSIILTGILVLLPSCSSPEGEPQDISGEISQKDMENGHIKIELMEKVSVDAKVTPYRKYQNGLRTYYLEPSIDNHGKSDLKEYKKKAVLFNQEAEKITGLIERHSKGAFDISKRKLKVRDDGQGALLSIPYKADNGEKKIVRCSWALDDNGQFAGTEFYFEADGAEDPYTQIGEIALDDAPMYGAKDFGFADCSTAAEEMRAFVEQVTGRRVSEEMYRIPMTEEVYNAVTDRQEIDRGKTPYPGEYYTFVMYFDVDGLPWKRVKDGIREKNGMKLAEDILLSQGDLFCKNEWPLIVAYNKDGIMELVLDSFFKVSKPYSERQKVCTPGEILDQVKAYFQDILLKVPVTIYEISLAYDSYFTDPEDGLIENVVRPFWIVRYWDGKKTTQLVFDAYNGKYID